jgi:hypothetical protein
VSLVEILFSILTLSREKYFEWGTEPFELRVRLLTQHRIDR